MQYNVGYVTPHNEVDKCWLNVTTKAVVNINIVVPDILPDRSVGGCDL